MIEWISNWAEGIIIAIIIATIIEMLLPEGKNKKYVKTVIGLYIVFTIISPVVDKFTNVEIDFNDITDYYEEVELPTSTVPINNEMIKKTYIEKLEKDIKERMLEKGYIVISAKFDVEVSNNNFGEVNKIDIKVKKKESGDKNNLNEIKSINITISSNTIIEEEKELSKTEKADLEEYIKENYGVIPSIILVK